MRVRDLIAVLEGLPRDLPVLTHGYESRYFPADEEEEVRVVRVESAERPETNSKYPPRPHEDGEYGWVVTVDPAARMAVILQ